MLAGFALLVHPADLKFLNMKAVSLRSNPLKVAFAGLLGSAAIISAPGQAQAANPIDVLSPVADAGRYTIQYVEGAWTDPVIQGLLTTQLWWNNSSLASELSRGLMNSTGSGTPAVPTIPMPQQIPNNGGANVPAWYLFATNTATVFGGNNVVQGFFNTAPYGPSNVTALNLLQSSTSYTWAIATRAPIPPAPTVPGPLPLIGAAAAFGFSRRLRSRINKSATA